MQAFSLVIYIHNQWQQIISRSTFIGKKFDLIMLAMRNLIPPMYLSL